MNILKTFLAKCKEYLTSSTHAEATRTDGPSFLGKRSMEILIQEGWVMLPDDQRALCPHPDWAPENRDNGWRSYCLKCGQPAAGSCQS